MEYCCGSAEPGSIQAQLERMRHAAKPAAPLHLLRRGRAEARGRATRRRHARPPAGRRAAHGRHARGRHAWRRHARPACGSGQGMGGSDVRCFHSKLCWRCNKAARAMLQHEQRIGVPPATHNTVTSPQQQQAQLCSSVRLTGSPEAACPGAASCPAAACPAASWAAPAQGAPTPGAGPARPTGAAPGAATGMPRPAARPMPGPPGAAAPLASRLSSAGGGPSIVRSTTSSPRRITKPSTRRCSRCRCAGGGMERGERRSSTSRAAAPSPRASRSARPACTAWR